MIRDADKLDHFRVKDVEKDTVLLGVTYEEAGKESITDEVYQQFCKHQLIYAPTRKTHLDMWISYIAFIFDLYFDESKSYIEKNHYIERSFDKIKIVLKPGFRRAFFDTLAVYKLNVGKFNSLIDYHLMNRATVSCFE